MHLFRRFMYVVLIAAALILIVNAGFFWQQWRYYSGQSTAVPQRITVEEKHEPNMLWIPSLGITAPIVYVEEANEDKFQEALINGVVHYPGTAEIGQPGNVYIFGHSSDFAWSKGHYKTVFALLPKIQTGAAIVVTDKQGISYNYIATETKIVSPKDTSVLDQYGNQKRVLSVQTSYPVGTALKRFVVLAELKE